MHNERLRFLFSQYVANRISTAELAELQAYIAQNPDDAALRRLVAEELYSVHEDHDAVSGGEWLHGLEAKVWEKITYPSVPRHTRGLFPWRRAIAVAASVMLVLAAGIWAVSEFTKDGRETAQMVDIAPGTNRATLELADGRKVDLSEAQTGIVVGDGIRYLDGSVVWPQDHTDHPSPATLYTLTTPKGGTYQVTLPDGTKVWLNAASTLTYPSRFDGEKREVEISGEGYFSVARDTSRPFRVISRGQAVEVLGTEFNITAYADEPGTKTTLVEGVVRVASTTNHQPPITLRPGQQATLNGPDIDIREVNILSQTAWKDGMMVWADVPLSQAIRQIERWYDVEFESYPADWDGTLGGSVPREVNLSEVLAALELNTGFNFRIAGRRVIWVR